MYARPQATIDLPARMGRIVPGVALLFGIGYGGKLAETALKRFGKTSGWLVPNIEYVSGAIIFGLVIGNVFGGRRWFRIFDPGIATYDFWLKLGIILLGVRFLLFSLLASLQVFTKEQVTSLANLSRWAVLLMFAGVGLRTNQHCGTAATRT